jgi:aminoglycoside phosphotransferase (APT) family kinase protein
MSATDAPVRVRALARVPGCEDGRAPLAMAPLAGGTANLAWHVRTLRGDFVVRINASDAALLGVDRRREAALQTRAAQAGLAPPLIAVDPEGAFFVMAYLSARGWQAREMQDPERLRALARRLARLHGLDAPQVAAFDPLGLLETHVRRIVQAEPASSAELAPLLDRARGVLAAAHGARPLCIVHNDLHHQNLLGAAQPYLLDWEYAAVTDPLYDLACVLAYYPRAQPHAQLLLEESGLAERASLQNLQDATWLYTLLSYLWYRAARLTVVASAADLAQEQALRQRLG